MRVTLLTLVFLTTAAAGAHGQPAFSPFDGRLFVNVNGVAQPGTQELTQDFNPIVYSEAASIQTLQSITAGAMVDVAVGYRAWRNVGVGLAFTSSSTKGNASASGQVPHPLFFNQPRSFSGDATDLGHTLRAVHLQVLWMHRVQQVDNLEVALSAGPSFFRLTQAVAEGVRFSETGPPFNSIRLDEVLVAEHQASPAGGNVGLDVTYLLTPTVGLGGFWRHAFGSTDLTLSTGAVMPVGVGGSQIGGGVRLRF